MKAIPLAYEVAHCSAWDDDHGPDHLVNSSPGNHQQQQPLDTSTTTTGYQADNVNSKGWQTPKCQSYPQDLIIHLVCGPARITKIQLLSHHYKIATKVDIYIGILKESAQELSQQSDDDSDTLIEFTRLGYIEFDDNARTQFRARELKSIKINADGEYIRLVVRNNHQNHLNIDNQVCLLTMAILGQPLAYDSLPSSLLEDQVPLFSQASPCTKGSNLSSDDEQPSQIYELPPFGVMELELQHWITSLLHAESLAVQDESYQKAKTYKQLSDRLTHLSRLLVTFEQAKRQASDTRNYDEAGKIKGDIYEIRQAAEAMIKHENIRIMEDGLVLPLNQCSVDDDGVEQQTNQDHMDDDTIAKWIKFATTTTNSNSDIIPPAQQQQLPSITQKDDMLMPINLPPTLSSSMSAKIQQRRQSQTAAAAAEQLPEPIMDVERATYEQAIVVFGESTVACVLDMKSKCRERGLLRIQQCINAAYPLATSKTLDQLSQLFKNDINITTNDDGDDDLGAYLVNATLMMFQEAIMDAREPIVILAFQIWHQLNDFYLAANVDPETTKAWTQRAFSGALRRTGDPNLTIRDHAVDLVLLIVHSETLLLDQFVCQPERMIHNHKEALARVHLVQRVLDELKLQQQQRDGLIALDRLVAFTLAYLAHGHEDVQQQAMQLLLAIGAQVNWATLAPLLDETTKESLQLKLQKKPKSPSHLLSNKDATVAELRALTIPSNQPEEKKQTLRKSEMNTTNAKRRPAASVDKKKSQVATKKPTSAKRTQRPPSSSNDTKPAMSSQEQVIPEDTMCIFCDEYNDKFNEQTLITHYYKNCPALTNCSMCQIIVEVSTLQSHTVTDCEKRHLMKQCTRCKQSIPVEQWLPHTLKATCSAYTNSEDETRCPLCLVTIEPANDEGWRRHLLTGGGCPKNPRGSQHLDNSIISSTTATTKKQQPSSSDKKQLQSSSIRMKPSSIRKK